MENLDSYLKDTRATTNRSQGTIEDDSITIMRTGIIRKMDGVTMVTEISGLSRMTKTMIANNER